MNRNQDTRVTTDEIICALNHSSFPAILVEGECDIIWYREFETELTDGILLFPVGGRKRLFDIYKRRNEIRQRVAFVADKDMMVFDGVPKEYSGVIFTDGYSIENDLLKNSTFVHCLFSDKDKRRLLQTKLPLSRWFAFCVERTRQLLATDMTASPQCVLSEQDNEIREEYKMQIGYTEPSTLLVQDIVNDFEAKFRGKNLAKLYAYIFSKRNNLGEGEKYRDSQLLEMAAKEPGSFIRKRFAETIKQRLNA